MSKREKWPSGKEQFLDRCRHFTGVQHERCKVGISYNDFRTEQGYINLPCHKSSANCGACDKAEWPTEAEADEHEKEVQKVIGEFIECIATGKCPICKRQVKQRQVGHCVYGTCGHRLYQGKVNKQFAETP